jgi:hypothetical protein
MKLPIAHRLRPIRRDGELLDDILIPSIESRRAAQAVAAIDEQRAGFDKGRQLAAEAAPVVNVGGVVDDKAFVRTHEDAAVCGIKPATYAAIRSSASSGPRA